MLPSEFKHFDLSGNASGMSRGAERLLLQVFDQKKMHYQNCCGQELVVRELVSHGYLKIDPKYWLSLTPSGTVIARQLASHDHQPNSMFSW